MEKERRVERSGREEEVERVDEKAYRSLMELAMSVE